MISRNFVRNLWEISTLQCSKVLSFYKKVNVHSKWWFIWFHGKFAKCLSLIALNCTICIRRLIPKFISLLYISKVLHTMLLLHFVKLNISLYLLLRKPQSHPQDEKLFIQMSEPSTTTSSPTSEVHSAASSTFSPKVSEAAISNTTTVTPITRRSFNDRMKYEHLSG